MKGSSEIYFIDTNIFLRLVLNDVPKQADKAEALLKKAKKGLVKILVPQIIIFEMEYALSKYYKFPKGEVIDKLESLLSTPYLTVQDGDIFRKSLRGYKDKSLSLVDCFLLAKAEIEGARIFTFDKDLAKRSKLAV